MAGEQQKISPRKFTEKIALLKKGEAEGNKQFDEIIKQVKATRIQGANSASFGSLQNVFDSRRPFESANNNNNMNHNYLHFAPYVDPYQAPNEATNYVVPQSACYSRLMEMKENPNQSIRSASADLNFSSSANIQKSYYQDCNNNNIVNQQNQFQCTSQSSVQLESNLNNVVQPNYEPASYSTCRARVTSFGSANQNRYNCQELPSSEMYLNPNVDKSLQKSRSDPILHEPYTPIEGLPATYQSENLLNSETPIEVDCNTVESYYQLDETTTNSQPNSYFYSEQPIERKLADYGATEQANQNDSSSVIQWCQVYDTQPELPGIEICTINDESQFSMDTQQPDAIDQPVCDSYNSERQVQDDTQTNSYYQYEDYASDPQLSEKWTQQTMTCQVGADEAAAPLDELLVDGTESVINFEDPAASLGYVQQPLAESLIPPKVNSLLSSSEMGLTNAPFAAQTMYAEMGNNNIMRSRSHNSIAHLTKQQQQYQRMGRSLYYSAGRQAANSHHQQYQQHQQLSYGSSQPTFLMTVCRRNLDKSSNSSMKPQLGSTSPLGSQTNLGSNQSEQNSPGSSTTDYTGECYLPLDPLNSCSSHICVNPATAAGQLEQLGLSQSSSQLLLPNSNEPNSMLAFESNQQQQQQPFYQEGAEYDSFQPAADIYLDKLRGSQQDIAVQPAASLIGPCQSPSSSRRAHNQVCLGSYANFSPARNTNQKDSNPN